MGRAVRIHANLKINKCILRSELTAVYEGNQWSESCGTGFCCIEVTKYHYSTYNFAEALQ